MPYQVHLSDADRAYLAGLPLSAAGKKKVEDFIDDGIAQIDEAARNDPSNRLGPNLPYFQRQFLLWDGGRCHALRFVVNDSNVSYGVLLIVYVDCS